MRSRGADFDDFVVGDGTRLQRMAIALTGDRSVAEDLVQDVLERMYVAWPRIDDPHAYARRALVNATANRWRRRSRRPERIVADTPEVAVSDRADEHAHRDELVRAISALPARQRAVIVLRFLEDMSEAEAATALGCSAGTVKSQTSRALSKLRELLPSAAVTPTTPIPARSSS